MSRGMRNWLVIIGGAAVVSALIWFGFRLLLISGSPSPLEFFILGCLAMLGGIVAFSTPSTTSRLGGVGLMVYALYSFLRGLDIISRPWLTTILGYASLVAAVVAGYVAWKATQQSTESTRQPGQDYTPE